MADNLTTTLRIEGDSASAQAAVAALMTSLRNAAAEAVNLFAPIFGQGNQAAAALNQSTAAVQRQAAATRIATDNTLALAQATARLQVDEGKAADAVETLKAALAGADKNTVAAINAQRQLVAVEANLATSAGKAETAMLNQARAIARAQQVAGDAQGAIKTLADALDKATNKQSLAAIRTEIQKTYLDTNYANSPLIEAIRQITQGLGFLRPLLGSTAGTLQTLTSLAGQAAQAFSNTKSSVDANAKSASAFLDTLKSVNQAIVNFGKDQGGSASATDFFLNLSKGAADAGERIRQTFAGIRDSIANAFTRGSGAQVLGLSSLTQEASALTPALKGVASAGAETTASLGGMSAAGSSAALVLGGVVAVVGALVIGLAALTAGTVAVTNGLFSIGEAGVKTNAQLESIKIGIDTVIASVGDIRNADGIQLKGIDALNAALPIAQDQLRKLRIDALETSATIADIAPAFQAAIGPGLVAGLTIDQIRENTIRLTQAVTALGLPLDQIKQETRAILSGDINRNTQAAIALGITREAALEAQKQGKFAEFLDEKLQAAAAAGKLVAQTFAAASSNLQEAGDTFQAVVTEGLFNQLRDKANQILPQIFDKNSATLISKNFEGIAETLTRVFDTAGASINKVIDFVFEGLKQVSSFLDRNQDTVGEIIESLNQIVTLVAETVKGVFEIAAGGGDAAKQLDIVSSILIGTVRVVAFIGDLIKQQVGFWKAVGGTIVAFVLQPVESLLRALAFVGQIIPGVGKVLGDARDTVGNIQREAINAAIDGSKKLQTALQNTGKAGEEAVRRIQQAREKAAKGERAVAGVESKNLASTGATIRPPKRPGEEEKGAAAKARQEAAALVKLLQLQEKQTELENKRITEGLRQALTDRLISLQDFTQFSIENDRNLLEKRLAALDAEEKAAVRSAKNATDAEAKRAEFKLKRLTLEQDADIKAEALRDDLRRSEEKAEEDHQTRLLGIRDAARKAIEATIRASVTSGLVGFEDAERRQIDLERERFAEREGLLNANLELARQDVAKRQEIQDQLELLAVERATFEEEASRRINEAQRKEAEGFVDSLRKRIKALVDLRKAQIDASGAQAALALQRGVLNARQAEEQEIQRRRDLLKIESSEREADIIREAEELKQQVRNQAGAAAAIVDIEKNKNAALKAEKDRAKAEDQVLENQQRAVGLQGNGFSPEAAESIAAFEQLIGRVSSGFEQFKLGLSANIEQMKSELPSLAAVFTETADAVAGALATNIAAFVSGAVSVRKAAAEFFKAALAPLKEYLLKKSKIQFAEAIASLAAQDYRGFALHSLAGTALAAAAGLIDAGGSAIAGGSSGAAGAAISGAGGAASNAPQAISRDTLADRGQRNGSQAILRPEIHLHAELRNGVLEIVHQDIRNNGTTRQLIQETTPTG